LPSLNNPQIRLMRRGQVYGISAKRVMTDPRLDTVLRAGDKVVIEEDPRYFLSLGAAANEALHPFPRDDLSALDAMSVIGGVSDSRADPKGILILREYPETALRNDGTGPHESRVVFVLDLTSADGLFSARKFPIRSGDLIYVTESAVTSTQTVFNLISSLFVVSNQASNL
jgi:polysaccharide export outer membrane protein